MDPHSGFVGTRQAVTDHMLSEGRNPADMVEISGPPASIERVAKAVASHRPNRKARRKAQRAARRRNR